MLERWSLRRFGGREELCMHWEGATDIFVLERSTSGFRLLAVRKGPQAGCPGKLRTAACGLSGHHPMGRAVCPPLRVASAKACRLPVETSLRAAADRQRR